MAANQYFLDIEDSDIKQYLELGMLDTHRVTMVKMLETRIQRDKQEDKEGKFALEQHKIVYDKILADCAQIQKTLDELEGSQQAECPKEEEEVQTDNGHSIVRQQWLGRHCITVKNTKNSALEWCFGIQFKRLTKVVTLQNGETAVMPIGVDKNTIVGFQLNSHRFLPQLFNQALESTKKYFPCENLPFWKDNVPMAKEVGQHINVAGPKQLIFSYMGFGTGRFLDSLAEAGKGEKVQENTDKPNIARQVRS